MSDPPRLLETHSTEAELLEAWSSMRAPASARAKALALAGLGAGAAATAVGASMAAKSAAGAGTSAVATTAATTSIAAGAGTVVTTAATASATGGLLVAKWMAAIGVVAALGGGSVVAAKKMSAPTVAPASTVVAAPAVSVTTHAPETRPPEPANGPAEAVPSANAPVAIAASDLPNAPHVRASTKTHEPATTGRRAEKASAAAVESEPAPAPSTLGAEVSSLDSARNALRGGDPARALRELDAFDAKHPGSALSEDAALLRFDASVALGDKAGADKAARTFLAKYPSSTRAAKVRRYLDGAN